MRVVKDVYRPHLLLVVEHVVGYLDVSVVHGVRVICRHVSERQARPLRLHYLLRDRVLLPEHLLDRLRYLLVLVVNDHGVLLVVRHLGNLVDRVVDFLQPDRVPLLLPVVRVKRLRHLRDLVGNAVEQDVERVLKVELLHEEVQLLVPLWDRPFLRHVLPPYALLELLQLDLVGLYLHAVLHLVLDLLLVKLVLDVLGLVHLTFPRDVVTVADQAILLEVCLKEVGELVEERQNVIHLHKAALLVAVVDYPAPKTLLLAVLRLLDDPLDPLQLLAGLHDVRLPSEFPLNPLNLLQDLPSLVLLRVQPRSPNVMHI